MPAQSNVTPPVAFALCTVAMRRELAGARVLADSVREVLGWPMTVLVLDEGDEPLPEIEGARVLGLDDVGLDHDTAVLLALTRSPAELSLSVRPRLMRQLLDGGATVVFLGPQTVVHAALDQVMELVDTGSVVLVPRLTQALPRDEGQPSETDALRSGVVDASFLAVGDSSQGRAFLDWWQPRSESVTQPVRSNLLDLVLGALDHHVLVREPGWNVGRWTAPYRRLTRSAAGTVLVQGRPLVWMNHEGYSPDHPHLFSALDATNPRTLLSEEPVALDLCEGYRVALLDAGHETAVGAPLPFAEVDGVRVDDRVRRLVSEHLSAGGDPQVIGSSLAAWLSAPSTPGPGFPIVGRLLHDVLAERSDLRVAFPELAAGQVEGLLTWAEEHGEHEEGVTRRLVDLVRTRLAAVSAPRTAIRTDERVPVGEGVLAVGFFTGDFGIGQAGRMLIDGLENAGVPVETQTYERTASRLGTPWVDRSLPPGTETDIAIMCLNADTLRVYVDEVGDDALRGRYVVGLWFWELEDVPVSMLSSLDLVDEVWVSSEFNRAALMAVTDKPVRMLPLPVHVAEETTARPEEMSAGAGAFTFGFVYDHLSVFERKNPLGLVAAYRRAFPEPGVARLVIKAINGSRFPGEREALLHAVRGSPDIVLIERYLSREELDGLMWGLDSFVSLHRAEGFGFTMAETMGMGKAVVGTDYSGNLTFMHPGNSRLVPCKMMPIPPGNPPYPSTSSWARPSLRHAARIMRRLHGDPELVARLGAKARRTIAKNHSPQAAGEFASSRIAEIRHELQP